MGTISARHTKALADEGVRGGAGESGVHHDRVGRTERLRLGARVVVSAIGTAGPPVIALLRAPPMQAFTAIRKPFAPLGDGT